jgi:DNA-nicking Smr family endonuclease
MSFYAPRHEDTFEPDLEIDLHGMTTTEAKMTLEEIIESGVYNRVRLIVGKGTRSDYGPVLPAFVKNILTEREISFEHETARGIIDATL